MPVHALIGQISQLTVGACRCQVTDSMVSSTLSTLRQKDDRVHLTLIQPDDWHVHLRDGGALETTVADCAQSFARAIVMPNLKPPVASLAVAASYRDRICAAVPDGLAFTPLMTLYLTPDLAIDAVVEGRRSGLIHGVKLYPQGATTNSDAGVSSLDGAMPVLDAMAEVGLPLLVHGEVTDREIDIFDREAVFLDRTLGPLMARLPTLRVVLEHITTADSVDFVNAHPAMGATITAHHLLYNRNDMLAGGIRPHLYCLPILKRERHRESLIAAATGASTQFFLGTDSAPHAIGDKESDCGCAGCYTAPHAMPLYATAFEAAGRLDRLEAFASLNGPRFYGLPVNTGTLTLEKRPMIIPESRPFGNQTVRLLGAGDTLQWSLT